MSALKLGILLATFFAIGRAAPFFEETQEPIADPIVWRLPDSVIPLSYNLTLKPYLREADGNKKLSFDGEVEIEIQANADVQYISLHKRNLTVSHMEYYLKSDPRNIFTLTELGYDSETNIWRIQTQNKLTLKTSYILHFKYVGSMGDDMHGFYWSSYVDEKNNTKLLGSTQFQSYHARRAFPCFDEPKFKANFTVSLIRPKSMKSVSNEEQIQSVAIDSEWYRDVYKTTPKMSSYLLAFIISEFNERFEGQLGVVARPEYYAQTSYAHDVGQRILNELDEYLGIKYYNMGIEKMHMAAIPDFSAGAMENWGLLTYREKALLYDPATTSLKDKQSIASIIAHEQAHMWFGDYVTCDWWSYTWLNEGFARYFQYFATNNVETQFQMATQFPVDQIQAVMAMDSTNATNPMSDENTNTPSDLSRMFNSISYNKGATFIRMTKHVIGEDNFKKSLNEYLNEFQYRNTVPENLFKHWRKYWKDAAIIDEYFKSFTEQVGYPVVTVNVTAFQKGSGFILSQKRFLLKENDGSDKNLAYMVPFTYTTDLEKNFTDTQTKVFLTKDSYEYDHKSNFSWVIANIQQVGYYRVNYDTKSWHRIHSALLKDNFDGIHELNRAQIVDDLLNLARAAHVDYDTAFDVIDFLRRETHYAPWTAAFNGLNYISIRSGTDQEAFGKYILKITEKAYNNLGFAETSKDTALDIYNRAKILSWVCKYGHSGCITKAKEYFNNLNTVPVNIRSSVYCTGIRQGREKEFDDLWSHSQKVNVATETVLVLNALGCTKEQALIEKYFGMILGNQIRKQDKSAALTSLYSENNENVSPVFKLVTENVDKLADAMGDRGSVASVISSIASRFTTGTQLQELQTFNSKNKDKFDISSFATLKKAEETVQDNLEWASVHMETVKNILITRGKSGAATLTSLSSLMMLLVAVVAFLK